MAKRFDALSVHLAIGASGGCQRATELHPRATELRRQRAPLQLPHRSWVSTGLSPVEPPCRTSGAAELTLLSHAQETTSAGLPTKPANDADTSGECSPIHARKGGGSCCGPCQQQFERSNLATRRAEASRAAASGSHHTGQTAKRRCPRHDADLPRTRHHPECHRRPNRRLPAWSQPHRLR